MNCSNCQTEVLPGREICPGCDWCKDAFFEFISDQYNIARRAPDESGMVTSWRLRSPGANSHLVATVSGWCGDEFDHGGIMISGGGRLMPDGHMNFDTGNLAESDFSRPTSNGVRPALWLRMKG